MALVNNYININDFNTNALAFGQQTIKVIGKKEIKNKASQEIEVNSTSYFTSYSFEKNF